MVRLVVGPAVLLPIARIVEPLQRYRGRDARRVAWMGIVGRRRLQTRPLGLARSTATRAALLIIVALLREPLTACIAAGGVHVVAELWLTVTGRE